MSDFRLGVLGGTFDPIHYGHLRVAEEALTQLRLDRVLFVPASLPPHKLTGSVTSAKHRLTMAVLATASHPCFEVSWIEMERDGPSYTVDTLVDLHAAYGNRVEIYFVLGADAVLEMHTWKEPERVMELCQLAISKRPGFDLERLQSIPLPGVTEKALFFEGPASSLSSTEVRQRIQTGRSIRYMIPEPVESYIYKQKLYGSHTTWE